MDRQRHHTGCPVMIVQVNKIHWIISCYNKSQKDMQTEFIRSQQVLKAMCRIFILRIGLMWGNGYTHYSLSGIPKVFFALKLLRPTERRTHRIITPIHKNKCRFRDKHEMCDLTIPHNNTKSYLHLPPSTANTNLQCCIYENSCFIFIVTNRL